MPKYLTIALLLCLCWPLAGHGADAHRIYVQHVEHGFASLFQGDNQGAIAAFEAALASEPEHYEIHHYLGMAYAQEQFWKKAVDAYQRSLALMPDNIEALYSLGVAHFRMDAWEAAVTPLQQVVALSPQHARGYEVLGKAQVKLRKYADAVDTLTKALALKPNAAGTYQELGTAYLNLKAYPEAIENFKLALQFGPVRYAEPHYGLGTAYLRLSTTVGEPSRAGYREKSREEMRIYQQLQKEYAEYERLSRLTRTEPKNLEGWASLASLLIYQKNYAEAVRVLQKCIELAPNEANFYHGLSQAFVNLNYPKPAAEAAQKAIQLLKPVSESSRARLAVLYNTLGSAYAMQGDAQNAVGAYRKAIELNDEQPYFHLNLAKLYESLGRHELAQEHYRAYEHYKKMAEQQE